MVAPLDGLRARRELVVAAEREGDANARVASGAARYELEAAHAVAIGAYLLHVHHRREHLDVAHRELLALGEDVAVLSDARATVEVEAIAVTAALAAKYSGDEQ